MPSIPECLRPGSTMDIGGIPYLVLALSQDAASDEQPRVLRVEIVPARASPASPSTLATPAAPINSHGECETATCQHNEMGWCVDPTRVGVCLDRSLTRSLTPERILANRECDTASCRHNLRRHCHNGNGMCERRSLRLEDPPISMPADKGENKARNDQASRELLAKAADHAADAKALLDRIAKLRESIGGEYLRVEEEKAREDYEALMAEIEEDQG